MTMYDDTATLIKYNGYTTDQYGNQFLTKEETPVYVQPRSVYQSEFYNAANLGLKPSLTLYLTNRADYHGEKEVKFQGTTYEVIRADWNAQRDGISLICEEKLQEAQK